MPRYSELEALEKREKIHRFWWDKLGAEGHISLPMLKKEIINEFKYKDNRSFYSIHKRSRADSRPTSISHIVRAT